MTAPLETRREDEQRTQSFFREINDRVSELSEARDATPPRFICECVRSGCGATVVLSLAEYAKVRSDPTCFIVLAGHEDATSQEVVERRAACVLVRNDPAATSPPRSSVRLTEAAVSR